MRMSPVARDYMIGTLFAAAVATVAIALVQLYNVHQFAGLNNQSALAMMITGSAAAVASTILSIYLCGS